MDKVIDMNVCCAIGSYKHQIPMPIKGRRCDIDICIADIITALNAANITTEDSCCGHGILKGTILLTDGRVIIIDNVKKGITPGTHGYEKLLTQLGEDLKLNSATCKNSS